MDDVSCGMWSRSRDDLEAFFIPPPVGEAGYSIDQFRTIRLCANVTLSLFTRQISSIFGEHSRDSWPAGVGVPGSVVVYQKSCGGTRAVLCCFEGLRLVSVLDFDVSSRAVTRTTFQFLHVNQVGENPPTRANRPPTPWHFAQMGKLILRKIIKIAATRRHILKLKCTKFDFGQGLAGFKGATSKGKGGDGRISEGMGR